MLVGPLCSANIVIIPVLADLVVANPVQVNLVVASGHANDVQATWRVQGRFAFPRVSQFPPISKTFPGVAAPAMPVIRSMIQ